VKKSYVIADKTADGGSIGFTEGLKKSITDNKTAAAFESNPAVCGGRTHDAHFTEVEVAAPDLD
jgi:hypothetical protein